MPNDINTIELSFGREGDGQAAIHWIMAPDSIRLEVFAGIPDFQHDTIDADPRAGMEHCMAALAAHLKAIEMEVIRVTELAYPALREMRRSMK